MEDYKNDIDIYKDDLARCIDAYVKDNCQFNNCSGVSDINDFKDAVCTDLKNDDLLKDYAMGLVSGAKIDRDVRYYAFLEAVDDYVENDSAIESKFIDVCKDSINNVVCSMMHDTLDELDDDPEKWYKDHNVNQACDELEDYIDEISDAAASEITRSFGLSDQENESEIMSMAYEAFDEDEEYGLGEDGDPSYWEDMFDDYTDIFQQEEDIEK